MSDPIDLEFDLDEPAEKVWRALSEPALRERWLGANDNGIDCEVLEAEPDRRLRLGWRETSEAGALITSTVTFELDPTESGGVRLRILHGDFAEVVPTNDAPGQWSLRWAA